jgi:hypothetical protein
MIVQTFREFFGFGKKKKKPANNVEDWRKMQTSDEFYSALSDATADMDLAKTKALGKKLFGGKVKAMMADAKTKPAAIEAIKRQFRREADIIAN